MILQTKLLWLVPLTIVLAIGFAAYLVRDILRRDTGTPAMRQVSGVIYEGAIAFLRRQYTTIGLLALATAIVIGVLIAVFDRYIGGATGSGVGLDNKHNWYLVRLGG